MTGTFSDRIGELREMAHLRDERLTASVVVDQVYAHYQHEHLEFRHPRGGRAKYLEAPLYAHYPAYLRDYAESLLRDGGLNSLFRSAERLSDDVELGAPREWGDLMRSGHPRLLAGGTIDPDTGRVLREREPKVHRLTRRELAAKSRAILRMRLAEGLTVYFFKGGRLRVIPGKNEPHALRGRL